MNSDYRDSTISEVHVTCVSANESRGVDYRAVLHEEAHLLTSELCYNHVDQVFVMSSQDAAAVKTVLELQRQTQCHQLLLDVRLRHSRNDMRTNFIPCFRRLLSLYFLENLRVQ